MGGLVGRARDDGKGKGGGFTVKEVPAGTRTLFRGPLISTRGGVGWEKVVPMVW